MTNKKTSRKRAPRATKKEFEERVEQCRGLLRLGFTKGDIKRRIKDRHKVGPRQIEDYLSLARERNREVIDKTEDEHLSDSLTYWSNILQESESIITRETRQLAASSESLKQAEELLDLGDGISGEEKEIALLRRHAALKVMDHSRRAIYSARKESMECRREMDKLLGCHAPVKHANTTKDGQDVDVPADSEPVTQEQEDAEWNELLGILNSRGGDGAAAMDKPKAKSVSISNREDRR